MLRSKNAKKREVAPEVRNMAKKKTSRKRGFSFDAIPSRRLKRGAPVTDHDSKAALRDRKFIIESLTEVLINGDAEHFAMSAHSGFSVATLAGETLQPRLWPRCCVWLGQCNLPVATRPD